MPLLIIFLIIIGTYCFSTFDKEESNVNVIGLILAVLSFAGALTILDCITS